MPGFHTRASPAQREATQTMEGPLLIVAGPGSGKTFTLVERIVYLITEKGGAPKSLFVTTFSEKTGAGRTRVHSRRQG
jgi:DNA helicase-2/ATP-dependent DNA helicase PcrA